MKIDEQEFRSFIANLDYVIGEADSPPDVGYYQICMVRAQNQLIKYKKMLETPKLSKFKQLKIKGF